MKVGMKEPKGGRSPMGEAIADRLTVVPSQPIPSSLETGLPRRTRVRVKASQKVAKKTRKRNRVEVTAPVEGEQTEPATHMTLTLTIKVGNANND